MFKSINSIKLHSNIITLDMVRRGIAQGLIKFKPSTDDGYEVVCHIGEYWFYFAGMEGEEMPAEEYMLDTPLFDIEWEVYEALKSLHNVLDEDEDTEYQYYYWYLTENLIPHQHITKKKFRKYLMSKGLRRNWANEVCEQMFKLRKWHPTEYILSYQSADILVNRIFHDIDIPMWSQVSF